MSNGCNSDKIPTTCADKFADIGRELGEIKTMLKQIDRNTQTWGNRVWGLVKGVALMVVGYILAQIKQ